MLIEVGSAARDRSVGFDQELDRCDSCGAGVWITVGIDDIAAMMRRRLVVACAECRAAWPLPEGSGSARLTTFEKRTGRPLERAARSMFEAGEATTPRQLHTPDDTGSIASDGKSRIS